ncbi:uncharacterized protein LOC100899451 isoform X2 [Galendromus occidentalis]|uniref:Uncharacterized protein LOC100899451 isoform X2 n=1 Tax=Galendromus occidentalis TaxID=34638 RepID=A0AAJ6QNL6_9ACAR|nr:uncharacterized protein LOC100899451 isoform X2 [Galendromus occidentalis]
MRALVVLYLVFALAAAQGRTTTFADDEVSSTTDAQDQATSTTDAQDDATSTTETPDDEDTTTVLPDNALSCIRRVVQSSIGISRNRTLAFLQKLSPKGHIDEVRANISAEYEMLQRRVEENTEIVLADRATCEENNENAVFKRSCGLLAKLSFVQKNTRAVLILTKNTIMILSRAQLDFATGNVLSNVIAFVRGQGGVLLRSVRDGVFCITNRSA